MSKFRASVSLTEKVPVVNNHFGIKSLDHLSRQCGIHKVAPLIKSLVLNQNASALERALFFTYKLEGDTNMGMDEVASLFIGDRLVSRFNRPVGR